MPDKKIIFLLSFCLIGGVCSLGVSAPPSTIVKSGIIKNKEANPRKLDIQPAPCPRIKKISEQEFIYDGAKDRFNHIPVFQLLDPDAGKGNQYKAYAEMDGKNVLLLRKVRISYDYEDTNIIDYEGPHPITGKPHVVYEGDGGFYANIHYAVVPYEPWIAEMAGLTRPKGPLRGWLQWLCHWRGRREPLKNALRVVR